MKRRRTRLLIGVLLLLLSLALLCWGYLPVQRVTDTLRLPPVHLPTPQGGLLLFPWGM